MRQRVIPCVLALAVVILLPTWLCADSSTSRSGRLDGVYEPSGVAQLSDGSLIVVEDEPTRPFWRLSPEAETAGFETELLKPGSPQVALSAQINDLEGITAADAGSLYAITSHSRQKDGKRDPAREKLVRLEVKGDRIERLSTRVDLRDSLVRAFPRLERSMEERKVKRKGGFNIEGLAFDPPRGSLWIGFRAPLFDNDALLIEVTNPQGAFEDEEEFDFADDPVLLDLDGGGIRDIAFSSRLEGYLILSQREGKKEKHFKLWLWDGAPFSSPRRVRIEGVDHFDRAEGITPVNLDGEERLLLVKDDGNPGQQEGATYLLIDFADLRIKRE